jgi:hypothetical protein
MVSLCTQYVVHHHHHHHHHHHRRAGIARKQLKEMIEM